MNSGIGWPEGVPGAGLIQRQQTQQVTRISDLITALPKVELHLHLEGALRYDTYCELAGCDPAGPDTPWLGSGYRFNGLPDFVTSVRTWLTPCFESPASYERVAYELVSDLGDAGVIYAELSFGYRVAPDKGLDFESVFGAIQQGCTRACEHGGIQVGLIVAIGRDRRPEMAEEMVRYAADAIDLGMVGIDLHGDETLGQVADFRRAFDMAREAGLGLRAHAGEGAGAASVWAAVRDLRVHRIAHGVRSVEDERLLDHLAQSGIALDLCPTSNVKLGVVASVEEHPIRRLYDQGITVTVSSDDPLFFRSDLTDELRLLHESFGFGPAELRKITQNGATVAFAGAERKAELSTVIDCGFNQVFGELSSD